MGEPLFKLRSDKSARLVGLVFACAGVGVVYWQGFLPLMAAMEHRPLIEYSVKLIVLGMFITWFGLFCLVCGLAGYTYVVEIKKRPRALKVFIGVSLVVSLVLIWLIEHVFAAYGYGG